MWVTKHLKCPDEGSVYQLIKVTEDGDTEVVAYIAKEHVEPLLKGISMSKVWQCDWCEEIGHNNSNWIKLDTDPIGPFGPPEFCSWQCVSEYAEQRAKNQR